MERGVTYIPWTKVKVEELESYREGGMLDVDTLNPGKHLTVILVWLRLTCCRLLVADFLMLSLYFLLCSEWNNAMGLNKQAAVNGALESVPADGTITAHIQVMLLQSLNTVLSNIASAVILLV